MAVTKDTVLLTEVVRASKKAVVNVTAIVLRTSRAIPIPVLKVTLRALLVCFTSDMPVTVAKLIVF